MHMTYGENGNVATIIKPLTIVRGHKRAIRERITDAVIQENTGRQNGTSLQHHLSRRRKRLSRTAFRIDWSVLSFDNCRRQNASPNEKDSKETVP